MKILLPIDGTECSKSSVHWAVETFSKNAEYYLLYVITPLPDLNTIEYDIPIAESLLKEARESLEQAGCRVCEANYLMGDPAEVICKYAHQIQADQIVLGSHGRHGLAKLILGSVSSKVMEGCNCPVTVHRDEYSQWDYTNGVQD